MHRCEAVRAVARRVGTPARYNLTSIYMRLKSDRRASRTESQSRAVASGSDVTDNANPTTSWPLDPPRTLSCQLLAGPVGRVGMEINDIECKN